MTRWVVLAAYAGLGAVLVSVVGAAWRSGRDVIGRAPIHPLALVVGKVCLIAADLALLADVLGLRHGRLAVPAGVYGAGLGVFLAGTALTVAALLRLGARTTVGLAEDARTLETGGVYRLGRNPMYLGLYLMAAGGALATLSLVATALTVVGVAIHHRVVLAEERFLRERLGDAWDRYAATARRYL